MSSVSNSKASLLRATAFLAIASAGLLPMQQAHAATGSIVSTSVLDDTTRCRFNYDISVNGTVNDAGTNDFYQQALLVDGVSNAGRNQQVTNGTTTNASTQLFSSGTTRGNWTVALFEQTSFAGATTNLIGSDSISRSDLIAAGGACAQLAPNQDPTASASVSTFNAAPGDTIQLIDAGSSDPDGDALSYQWTAVGPVGAVSNPNSPNASVTINPSATTPNVAQVTLQVTDAAGGVSDQTIQINIAPRNNAPTADAGADQQGNRDDTFTFSASGSSDPDNDPLTYSWSLVSGPGSVNLSNANTDTLTVEATPSASAPGNYVFQVQVDDGNGGIDTSSVELVLNNQAPSITLPPDETITVQPNQSLTRVLVPTAAPTDPENDVPFTFQWTQIAGPAASISSPTTGQTNVTFPAVTQATVFTFELTTTDAFGASSSDTQSFTLSTNQAPVVDAGPDQNVAGGNTVTLAGTATDADNDPLATTWVQTGGTTVTLSNPNALNPTFTAPGRRVNDQVLTFELRADDGTVVSTDDIQITVAGNEAPNAVAVVTPSTGNGNTVFTLDGSGTTDPEGDAIIYQWVQTGGPAGTIADASAVTTTFTAPQGGASSQTLQFELHATDTFDESGTDVAGATLSANGAPTADPGNSENVIGGSTVTLDGSGSTDPDGDALTYTWTQTGGPTVTLSDPNAVQPTFTAPASTGQLQALFFELTVSDGVLSDTRGIDIDVLANQPPVADAGSDQGPINGGATVMLDGSGSRDPDGDTLTYSWVQTGGPAVTLDDASAVQPTFTAPNADDTVTFELTVSDGTVTARDTVSIETRAVGSITIIQQATGSDTQVSFTSNLAALSTTLTTSGGIAQVSAQAVTAGTYSVTAGDLSAQGITITDITCSDGDSSGNVSSRTATIELAAGEDVTCTFTSTNSREAAQVAIYNFLTGRNALILANQPDLQRRIDRLTGGNGGSGSLSAYGVSVPYADRLPVQANISEGAARFSSSLGMAANSIGASSEGRVFDIWGEAAFSSARIGAQDANFSIISVGADIKFSDNLLIGALAQFDDLSDEGTLEAGEAEGDGYLIGPYLTARLAEGFFVEARAAWGSSDNMVSSLAGQRDAFQTSRSLYSGSLIGQLQLGDRTTFRPALTVRYLSEDQEAYTDSLGIAIPSQTVDQGDVSLRPRISHEIDAGGGFSLRPFGQFEGIYTFGTEPDAALANLLPGNFADTFGDFRGRIEGGVDFMGSGSFRGTLSGFYDGIGADGFSNEGVRIGISFGF